MRVTAKDVFGAEHKCRPFAAQVEYCFTGEGSDAAPAPASLRGLDAAVYYRGGALLNCGHAAVPSLLPAAPRSWGFGDLWRVLLGGWKSGEAQPALRGLDAAD